MSVHYWGMSFVYNGLAYGIAPAVSSAMIDYIRFDCYDVAGTLRDVFEIPAADLADYADMILAWPIVRVYRAAVVFNPQDDTFHEV